MSWRQWLNAGVFQLGWLICVVGGNRSALVAGPVLLAVHFVWISRSPREWCALLAIAAIGIGVDSALHAGGIFRFVDTALGVPPWLAVLWLLFATTLAHGLRWLQGRLWLAAALGAVAGPLSYYAGTRLGAAAFGVVLPVALIILAAVWALLLPLLSQIMKRSVFGG